MKTDIMSLWLVQDTKDFIKRFLPVQARQRIKALFLWPPRGLFLGRTFKRLEPLSRRFGLSRGLPIDRYYIEKFLEKNHRDIRGRVLEIADRNYTVKFGGQRVIKSDVMPCYQG